MEKLNLDWLEVFKTITKVIEQLNETLLSGWPADNMPTKKQCAAIISTKNELMLHFPLLNESPAWAIAGNIVARQKRDWLRLKMNVDN